MDFKIIKLLILISCWSTSYCHEDSLIIYFNTNKSVIDGANQARIEQLSQMLSQKKIHNIQLYGSADKHGSMNDNYILSKNRCHSVSASLKSFGYKGDITPIFLGEEKPVSNKNLALNRYVKIKWEYEFLPSYTLKDLYEDLRPEPQIFCINNKRDTTIYGEFGTELLIRANSFDSICSGNECVKVMLSEVYTKSQMIRENLTTITPGYKILVSEAMYKLSADCDLSPSAKIVAKIATDSINFNTRLFDGHWNENNHSVWSNESNFLNQNQLYNGNWTPREGIVFSDSVYSDTTFTECKFFFCKIKRFLRMETPPEYQVEKKTIRRQNAILRGSGNEEGRIVQKKTQEDFEKADIKQLKNYVFDNNILGWRNLDWLMKIPASKKTNLIVDEKPSKNTAIKMIFQTYRSVVPLSASNDQHSYNGAPTGEPIWILAFKVEEDKIYIAIEDTFVENGREINLNFQEVSKAELFEKLKMFDSTE